MVLLAIAVLLSTNRWAINLRAVVCALLIQAAFAFVVLYWDFGRQVLRGLPSVSGGTVRRKLRSYRD